MCGSNGKNSGKYAGKYVDSSISYIIKKRDVESLQTANFTIEPGDCRVDGYRRLPRLNNPELRVYPYDRCVLVESTLPSGNKVITSGFVLSEERVITSSIHANPQIQTIRVGNSQKSSNTGGPTVTRFNFVTANAFRAWSIPGFIPDGLLYCLLGIERGFTFQSASDNFRFTTIGASTINGFEPKLYVAPHDFANLELWIGSSQGEKRAVYEGEGNVTNTYNIDVGFFGETNDIKTFTGAPIFVNVISFDPATGASSSKFELVGITVNGFKDYSTCRCNVGLFEDAGAIQRLLDAF